MNDSGSADSRELGSAMFGSYASMKRQRVNTLRLIHSLALRARILDGFRELDAVTSEIRPKQVPDLPCYFEPEAHANGQMEYAST